MLSILKNILMMLETEPPAAYAYLKGNSEYPKIKGMVLFYSLWNSTFMIVVAENLPKKGFLGFHIHEGVSCTGTKEDEFADAKGHYNPGHAEHPEHAGDLPPLLENEGFAVSAFLTGRFKPEEIAGRTVIIHGGRDDFTSQPSGDSGMKIACGEIILNR